MESRREKGEDVVDEPGEAAGFLLHAGEALASPGIGPVGGEIGIEEDVRERRL